MLRRLSLWLLGVGGLIVFAIQLVPVRVHNPPVTASPAWDSPQTEELARRACMDCHSNEVRTPWYGYVAPFSWVIVEHVEDARAELNLSEMDRVQEEAHEAGEEVREGEMPPAYYVRLHPEARLSSAEREALAGGLERTLGGESDHE